ncbi:MAG: protein kinase [Pyrinomonadaceae bacterium]
MTCHECGSDVAENDAFCPFCGITLERPVAVQAEIEDSMESTIMIEHADLSSIAGPVPPAAEEVKTPPTPFSVDPLTPQPEAFDAGNPEVMDAIEDPLEEIPASQVLDGPSRTSDHFAMPTSDYILGAEERPAASNEPVNAEKAGEIIPEDIVSEATAPEPEVLIRERLTDFGSTPAGEQAESPEMDPQPAIIKHQAEPEPVQSATVQEVEADETHTDTAAPNEDLYVPRVDNENTGISKPLEDLEIHDSFASNSTFDSVKIMENEPPFSQENVATRIASIPVRPDPRASAAPAVQENTELAAPIPQTAERIGVDTDGKKRSKLKPLTEGTMLNNRYEIVRKIGGGGMGAVYLASDNNLGGVLRAVKEMVQTHIEEEQQDKAINDFKRESMILSTLDHVCIPTIYDYFYDEKESRFYLVMKYISGGDLSSRLRSAPEGKIEEKGVTEWAIQIIDVLDYLHNQPTTIVYRDLKPSNIMIDGNSGRVMLIDFGIARSIHQKEEKGVTAVGTMGYAPPELFSGNVEPRSDIYSLGSTMFHLLTGADPQSNPLLIFDFQKNPRPRQINPQLSDQMERILMRSVEYNADARFDSAAEMKGVLEEHLANIKSGDLTYGVVAVPASVSLAYQNVFCGFCGQRIVATDLFCAFCGAKQPIAQQGVHSEIYSQASATAKLLIEGTSELSAPQFSLQKSETLVGRRDPMSNIFPEVDLSKYDPQTKISRRHARIWRDGNSYLVEDLGSSNGTILASGVSDALRLPPHKPHVLASGDKIKIGDTTLFFVVG